MKRIFVLFSFLAFIATGNMFCQSWESQLKIIFGDILQESQYKELRTVGKALSTSGAMNYDMERIRAQNNQVITINTPPNTYLGPNNQILPVQGYLWRNPSNPQDYNVIPMTENSYPTLNPYDLNLLRRKFVDSRDITNLDLIFTYNWYSDINFDKRIDLSEFNNIKRTFYYGEKIELAWNYSSWSDRRGGMYFKVRENTIHFIVQLFNAANGELILREDFDETHKGNVNMVRRLPLGNYLPPGKYMVTVSLTYSSLSTKGRATTSLREYFEVLE